MSNNDLSLYELLPCVDIIERQLNIVVQRYVTDVKNDDEKM